MNKRNGKKNQRIKRIPLSKNRNLNSEKQLEIQLIKTYPRQVTWDVRLPCVPLKLITTVATGVIAQAYPIYSTAIAAFATRFGSTFVEYRIVKCSMNVKCFSSTNPGVVQTWFDEQSAGAPTAAEATERYISTFPAASVDMKHVDRWTCGDPLDLQYRPIATVYTPVTYKLYTNNATFGSSIVATDYLEIEGSFRVQFRGLVGV